MSDAREADLALLIADLCGYTALTETHGALTASETVLRFVRLAESCLEPGVAIVDSIGDEVFCAGADTLAVVRTALRLRDAVEREPDFLRVSMGIHRGPIVEREGRIFGAPINLTARLAAHALGGQILCTEPIAQSIGPTARLAARRLGERRFKNVPYTVRLFELVRVTEGRAATVTDPVCRMQVAVDGAAAAIAHAGVTYRFCSSECARLFSGSPGVYAGAAVATGSGDQETNREPSRRETAMTTETTYTLDQFLADTRATIKTRGIPSGLAEIRDHLEKLLHNPQLLKKHLGDPPPYTQLTTIGHDPVTDVHVLVHGREKASKSSVHDHGPCWVVYGNYKNPTRMRRWRRLDDGTRPGYAELELQREFLNEPGHAVAFAVGDIHSIEFGDDTFFIRVTGGDVETKETLRFDVDKKTVEVANRAQGQR